MDKVNEIAKKFLDFILNNTFHDFCRQVEGVLIEIALLVILAIGLLRILRDLLRDDSKRESN